MPNQFAARDANNNIVTLESLPTVGQKANAASLPVTLSTEQNATLSAIASSVAGTIAVSGTFWQATQPVSGTFWQATQPVSLTTLPALVAGSSVIGKVSIDQTTPGTTNLVQVASNTSTYQEGTITTGNTAQNLFSGVTPTNGYEIINNSTTEILYFREAGTAAVAGASSIGIAPGSSTSNPGSYNTPQGYKPSGAISVIAATTGHAFIARSY